MGVTLYQDSAGRFPDRPVGAGHGMRAVASAGDGGAFVTIEDLGEPDVLHVRVLVNATGIGAGRSVLMIGVDAVGAESFRLTWDSASGQAELSAGTTVLACDIVDGLGWHALEWRLDRELDEAELWCNGVEVDADSAIDLLPTDAIHLGLLMKDASVLGELFLDELVVADDYVGPVRVEPTSPHADDPTRWLVVYNINSPESVTWAEAYRQARRVPYANLCGLVLSAEDAISFAECQAMVDAVEQYVSTNGLADQIMGVLLGHGVPGLYTRNDSVTASVTDAMQRRDDGEAEVVNHLVTSDGLQRPTPALLNGDWLTVRIDGPTVADSIALIDRASAVIAGAPIDAENSMLWLDFESGSSALLVFENILRAWSVGEGRQATRLPMTTTDDDAAPGGYLEHVSNDGFIWGFLPSVTPVFFSEPQGWRVLANPLTDVAATATALRDPHDSQFCRTALDAGYASVVGTVRPISPTAFADPGYFFEAIGQGWALGEAWHAASPLLRAGVVLIGDPLMTVSLPKAGWNIYGPFDSSADVSWDQPLAMLREDERTWTLPLEQLPATDAGSMFIVTQVDDQGREQRGFNFACTEGVT